MRLYRARDIVRVPTLLSLARLPLGVLFASSLGRPLLALTILGAAGLSDVLDGWYARRFGQVTAIGAVLDAVADKVFVLIVVASMVLSGRFSVTDVFLLNVRELGELPLVLWLAVNRRPASVRAQCASNSPGKAATVLQFATLGVSLLAPSFAGPLIAATALLGAIAAIAYWLRARQHGSHPTPVSE